MYLWNETPSRRNLTPESKSSSGRQVGESDFRHFLRVVLISARDCFGEHVDQLQTSVNEYSSKAIDVFGTIESELNDIASGRKGIDDLPSHSSIDALPGVLLLLP